MTRKSSRRFDQTWVTSRLVPALLIVLAVGLVATLVVIALSMANVL